MDVVFPLLHGPYGEDGSVQGTLETLDIAGICHVDARVLATLPNLTSVAVSMQVDAQAWPVRAGLEVTTSNPYAICSP